MSLGRTSVLILALAAGALAAGGASAGTYADAGLRWKRAPALKDMWRLYPFEAKHNGIPRGAVKVDCTADAKGKLACAVLEDSRPEGGFGKAALAVMKPVRVEAVDGGSTAGKNFQFTLKFGVWRPEEYPESFQPSPALFWKMYPGMTGWDMVGQKTGEVYRADYQCTADASGYLECKLVKAGENVPERFLKVASNVMASAKVTRRDGASPQGETFPWRVEVKREGHCTPGWEFVTDENFDPCRPAQVQVRN